MESQVALIYKIFAFHLFCYFTLKNGYLLLSIHTNQIVLDVTLRFPGWWPIDWLVSKSAGAAHFGSHFDTMRNDSRFRCRYKSLQSRFITENILQFNSIKTISILDLFMLPIHSYHLAWYICFNWCSVTVQWSWNGNNTQSQFILHFVYAHNGTRHGKEAATPKRTITKKSIAHAHAQT